MRPYVSVDIETTGIQDNAHILQIAAIYDDLKSPVSELPMYNAVIKYDVMSHCEPYAMGMNAELLKKMMDKEFYTCKPHFAAQTFLTWLLELGYTFNNKVLFAGKNVASFDIPKLKHHYDTHYRNSEFSELVHYKTLDVGSLYFDKFGDNVNLSKINKLTGRKDVSHDALDDAMDVVYAVRYKLGVPTNG
jgi:hypothetical protein